MTDDKKPIIKIDNLSVIYNQGKPNEMRSLENVSLEILPQEYVIIFGPSGCGKSTLLYSIAGLQRPSAGEIDVDGESITGFNKRRIAEFRRMKIGMVFQAFYLVPSLSIIDNICLPKVFSGEDIKKRVDLAKDLMERFNISDQARKFPSELSGGQKQRVSIARSLINNPDIILADEPVGNLDSKSAYNVMSILKDLNEIDKKTIILVTHDPSHLKYGNRIIHIKDGKIIKIEVNEKVDLPSADSYIFKDGEIRTDLAEEGLIKKEIIPADLRLLMRAFKSLSAAEIGTLLVPFKSEQIFSHIFLSITNEQLETAKKKIESVFYDRIDWKNLEEELDKDVAKGGAGWDKRTAQAFAREFSQILAQTKKIDFAQVGQSASKLADYMTEKFHLKSGQEDKNKLSAAIVDRLNNKIGAEELKKIIDMPRAKGGLGLDSRMATKIAKEMELLLLIRYSA